MSARGAVNLNELPPEVQAKIALQISGASIDRESLARKVVDSMTGLTTTLKDLEDDIRRLWFEFDNLKDGETIMGCSTKKAFCETHLKKTPRAVRYMLAGGNTNRGETFSPDEPDEDVPAEPKSQPKQNGIFNLLSALQKAIRRNDEREALLAAWQLDAETGKASRTVKVMLGGMWSTLRRICAEDIGLANPAIMEPIERLWRFWEKQTEADSKHEPWRLFTTEAVMLLCQSPKSRRVVPCLHCVKRQSGKDC